MTVRGLQYRYEVRHLHQEMWDSITVAIHVMHIVQLETSCVPDRFFFRQGFLLAAPVGSQPVVL